jgi:glutamine amidotransferase
MGWNEVSWQKESPIINSLSEKPRYYFVHSYFVECNHQDDVLGTTHYGQEFVSAFQHDNIIGMQFHPEKSHRFGMELVQNFAKL